MNRRTFLGISIASLSVLAIPTAAVAVATLKGYCANDAEPTTAALLEPDWLNIAWHPLIADLNNNFGNTKYAVNLSELYWTLNSANLQAVMAHPSYDHWFLLGNEPDLAGTPPAQFAAEVSAQIDTVFSVDPLAQFALAAGTFEHPMYESNSFFQQVWASLSTWHRKKIKAFHTHLYPNANLTITDYFDALNDYRNANYPNREIWITEIGVPLGVSAPKYNLPHIFAKANQFGIARVSWYAEKALVGSVAASYNCLLDAAGQLTTYGQTF